MTTPRIYVACLASYNNGVLHGRWIDASADVADMWPEINAMLRESKFPNVTVSVPDYEASARAHGWTVNDQDEFTDGTETLGSIGPTDPDGGWPTLCDAMGYDIITKDVPSAEEWAIHDYEGLGADLGEYAGLDEVAKRVALIEAADEIGIPAAVLSEFAREFGNSTDDADDIAEKARDAYRGQFEYRGESETWGDMAADLEEETGGLDEVPERFRNYIDFEAIGRDLRLGGDLTAYEHDGDLYFFWNH